MSARAFRDGERLYGRDDETLELLSLLIADRVVLLHAYSGVGKTSLVQAALLPWLRHKGFHPMPTARLNLEPGARDCNRYLRAAVNSMEDRWPGPGRIPVERLEHLTLARYLKHRLRTTAGPWVLVFDQFEEVLSLDPTDVEKKREFFRTVGEVLADRRIWCLFSMREDVVPALEPYVGCLPGGLTSRFRLDLLDHKAAVRAVQFPAARAGVTFEEDAAVKLVEELRRVWVQQLDGSWKPQLGPSVEPVHLQVVCRSLWEKDRKAPDRISMDDLEAAKDHAGDWAAGGIRRSRTGGPITSTRRCGPTTLSTLSGSPKSSMKTSGSSATGSKTG